MRGKQRGIRVKMPKRGLAAPAGLRLRAQTEQRARNQVKTEAAKGEKPSNRRAPS